MIYAIFYPFCFGPTLVTILDSTSFTPKHTFCHIGTSSITTHCLSFWLFGSSFYFQLFPDLYDCCQAFQLSLSRNYHQTSDAMLATKDVYPPIFLYQLTLYLGKFDPLALGETLQTYSKQVYQLSDLAQSLQTRLKVSS